MAKSTREEALKTKERIVEAAIRISCEKGAKELTYTNIAKEANMSRSGINAHFNTKKELMEFCRPVIGKMMAKNIDLSSGKLFYDSWVKEFESSPEFRNLLGSSMFFFEQGDGAKRTVKLIGGDESDEEKMRWFYMSVGYAMVNRRKNIT